MQFLRCYLHRHRKLLKIASGIKKGVCFVFISFLSKAWICVAVCLLPTLFHPFRGFSDEKDRPSLLFFKMGLTFKSHSRKILSPQVHTREVVDCVRRGCNLLRSPTHQARLVPFHGLLAALCWFEGNTYIL